VVLIAWMRTLVAAGVAMVLGSCSDGSGEEVVTITATPPDPSTSTTATFAFTSESPSGVAFTCALDDGPDVACTSPITYTDLSDYEHTFTVRAVSPRGSGMATASWRVDLEPPQRELVTIHGRPYIAYQAPGSSFRVVCAEPCAIDDRYLQARYQGFRRVHAHLVAAMGIDVLPELRPVDLHLTADAECVATTLFSGYSWWDRRDPAKPAVCLFELEGAAAPPPIVARPLTEENALALRNQVLAAHEYGHTILFKRHIVSHEWLVQSLSFFVTDLASTPCDLMFSRFTSAATAYQLCERNGFRFEDLAPSLQEIDALYHSGQGYPDWFGETTTSQLRHILDRRLGSSTFQAFLDGGYLPPMIGEDRITITPAGGRLAVYGGWVTLDVPAGAVAAPITIDDYPLFAAMPLSQPEWLPFQFATNYPLAAQGVQTPLAQPISITIRYDPALIPAGGDPSRLGIYGSTVMPAYSVAATNVVVDQVNHTVTGQIRALATYALAPSP
jgi:hypothetical protein